MKKRWFRDEDGTYYRNCNLIAAEIDKLRRRPWRWLGHQIRDLETEYDHTWRQGLTRKDALGPGDIEIKPMPMRLAYPQHPILWTLDKPSPALDRIREIDPTADMYWDDEAARIPHTPER